jgi:hypothetical protein
MPSVFPPAARENPKPDFSSFQACRVWQKRVHGVAFPESELRQLYAANPDGTLGAYCCPKVRDAMFKGLEKPDFFRIKVPVLAFFAALSLLKSRFVNTTP